MTIGLHYRALSSMQALGGRAGPSRRGRAVRSRHDTASVSRQKTMTLRLSVQRTSLRVMNWSAASGMPSTCRIDGSNTDHHLRHGWGYYFSGDSMYLRIPTQKKIGKEPFHTHNFGKDCKGDMTFNTSLSATMHPSRCRPALSASQARGEHLPEGRIQFY